MDKLTPGKWLGIVSFFNIILNLLLDKIIILVRPTIDPINIYKLSLLSYFVFMAVWGAVFGSTTIKKLKNK